MRFLLFVAMLVASAPTFACSFAGGIEVLETSRPFVAADVLAKAATLPATKVLVKSVHRGSEAPGSSCGDAGTLTLKVFFPRDHADDLERIGFYFRIVKGVPPDAIFPDVPMRGERSGRAMEFFFPWLDGHPSQQKPIDLEVEVRAVDGDLNVGPPTTFRVEADRG